MLLYEKYRPASWPEVIGQNAAIQKIDTIRRVEGLPGQCVWLVGKSGSGKTTIARLLAHEACDPAYIIELNAADISKATLREWADRARYSPISCQAWAFIINETHAMPSRIVTDLLTLLESSPWQRNCLLIGTTTLAGESLFDETFDAAPFGSRTKEIRLSCDVCKPFAKRASEIATIENLNGRPIEDYIKLMRKCQNNMREALNRIASGEMLAVA
jgi:energy-coupling factor transporter ATP-binding protein EcfA2